MELEAKSVLNLSKLRNDQASIERVVSHLPAFLQTDGVRAEIARGVDLSGDHHEDAALKAALGILERFSKRAKGAKLTRMLRR